MSAAQCPAAGPSTQYRWRFDRIGGPGEEIRQWVLTRNCALAPRQLGACIAALVAVTLLIGAVFASCGYWMVLPFAGVETLALAASFLVYSRHAADRERIVAAGDRLVVEWTCGMRVSRIERIAKWVRVDYGGRREDLVRLVVGGSTIEVGRYVPGERRGMLAHELRSVLTQERRHCRQGV
ncbi:MAG: DUF2244 domain-containing protein [Burkholderiaceae bacterium]|nr:DUF2244 domain-containing protein [Burkholderiaceae bacterium]